MESIAFKEWAIVCEALGRGAQCIILRKGGIAEGREGFSFCHREFFLFPTFFHEQIEKTRLSDVVVPERRDGEIELRFRAKVDIAKWITSHEIAESLEPLHILKREVVQERFRYEDHVGLHVTFVRIFECTLSGSSAMRNHSGAVVRGWTCLRPQRDSIFNRC